MTLKVLIQDRVWRDIRARVGNRLQTPDHSLTMTHAWFRALALPRDRIRDRVSYPIETQAMEKINQP